VVVTVHQMAVVSDILCWFRMTTGHLAHHGYTPAPSQQ